jgi:hypothetical protein
MNRLLLLLLALTCTGCTVDKITYGPQLQASGRVISLLYSPAFHDSDSNIGFTTGGNMTVVPSSIDIPEHFGAVFQWSHGRFALSGPTGFHKQLYENLTPGEDVVILYRERYVTPSDAPTRRHLSGYDFIDIETAPPAEAN